MVIDKDSPIAQCIYPLIGNDWLGIIRSYSPRMRLGKVFVLFTTSRCRRGLNFRIFVVDVGMEEKEPIASILVCTLRVRCKTYKHMSISMAKSCKPRPSYTTPLARLYGEAHDRSHSTRPCIASHRNIFPFYVGLVVS